MGVIFGVTIDLNHQITENYIWSILLSCFLIIILLKFVGSFEIYEAIISGLMAISLYLAIEFINVKTLQVLTGIDPITLQADFIRRILWFLPQLFVVLALSHIIRYFVNRDGNRKLMN